MKKILFVSSDLPDIAREKLSVKYDIRLLPPCGALPAPVSKHADMLTGVLDGRLITARSYYEKNRELFCGADPVLTDEEYGGGYPFDVLLDFIDAGTAVIGLEKHITARAKTKRIINVKQGYTRCSALAGRDFAVSADKGILSALESLGSDTLRISPGYIALPGYDCGFIGGAAFCDGGDVYFFGSLSYHKDGESIKKFLHGHGAEIYELYNAPLIDLGGAVTVCG